MKLHLDPMDLAPRFTQGSGGHVDQAISTRDVTFDKLTDQAQAAVRAVGRATFYSWDRQTYQPIYAPATEKESA